MPEQKRGCGQDRQKRFSFVHARARPSIGGLKIHASNTSTAGGISPARLLPFVTKRLPPCRGGNAQRPGALSDFETAWNLTMAGKWVVINTNLGPLANKKKLAISPASKTSGLGGRTNGTIESPDAKTFQGWSLAEAGRFDSIWRFDLQLGDFRTAIRSF